MEVVILQDAKEIGGVAADAIGALSSANPARFSAWPPVRRRWRSTTNSRARCDAGLISFQQARGFTLDEYVGLPADHPQRYRTVIDDGVRVPGRLRRRARSMGPDGLAADIPAACAAYEDAIREAGGVDLQILGIGTDGHIAFNEPGSSLALADPDQDADQADAHRQRPVLR